MAGDAGATFPMFPQGGFDSSKSLNRFSGAFPDPYLDYASTQMPRSIYDVLRWCEYVWLTYGVYRTAAQRVVAYFLTQIELSDASDDEKEKYETFLDEELKIMQVLFDIGCDYMAYGNSFISIRVPFRRYLRCPKCALERPIDHCKYSFISYKFTGKCGNPECKHEGTLERVDRRSIESDGLKVIRWSPHEIKLLYHPIIDKTSYLWDIPGWFKGEIKKGNPYYIESTPWEIVEAVKANELFRFHDEVIYHTKEPTLAGVRCFGWGIPRIMGNFKQAWYLQVLKRYNEAIALDYIIPFRVMTPVPGSSGAADPILHMNLQNFEARAMGMFRMHRKDPTTLHAFPFPVKLELLGGEGKNLAPTDLIDKGTDEFLNAQGVPAEMYRGTIQWQAMPVTLRLFERTWVHMVGELNGVIGWLFKRVSELQNWENLKGRLQPVTLADDTEKKMMQLQLAAGSQISKQTAFAPFGINVREEIKRKLQEEEYEQEAIAKHQEDQAQRQDLQRNLSMGAAGQPAGGQPGQPQPGQAPQQGGQPDPNAPPPPPPSPSQMASQPAGPNGVTPEDMMAQAEQIAYRLLGMPYEQRRSELNEIKKANETLHSLIISKMKEIRGKAQQVGGQQVMQQQLGPGAQ